MVAVAAAAQLAMIDDSGGVEALDHNTIDFLSIQGSIIPWIVS